MSPVFSMMLRLRLRTSPNLKRSHLSSQTPQQTLLHHQDQVALNLVLKIATHAMPILISLGPASALISRTVLRSTQPELALLVVQIPLLLPSALKVLSQFQTSLRLMLQPQTLVVLKSATTKSAARKRSTNASTSKARSTSASAFAHSDVLANANAAMVASPRLLLHSHT